MLCSAYLCHQLRTLGICDTTQVSLRNNFAPYAPREFPVRNLIANLVVPPMTAIGAVVPWMRPVSPDQRLHRVKPRVPEKPHKHLELTRQTVLCRQRSASPFPKTSPPERSLAMNVLVAARKKTNARPAT